MGMQNCENTSRISGPSHFLPYFFITKSHFSLFTLNHLCVQNIFNSLQQLIMRLKSTSNKVGMKAHVRICVWTYLLCHLCALCSDSALSKNVPTQSSQPEISVLNGLSFQIIIKWNCALLYSFMNNFQFSCILTWKCFNLLLTDIFSLCVCVCAIFYRRNIRFGSNLLYFLLAVLTSFLLTHCFISVLMLTSSPSRCLTVASGLYN